MYDNTQIDVLKTTAAAAILGTYVRSHSVTYEEFEKFVNFNRHSFRF